jgi:hypothetical protein
LASLDGLQAFPNCYGYRRVTVVFRPGCQMLQSISNGSLVSEQSIE